MGRDPTYKEGQDVEKLLSITLQNREICDYTLQLRSYSPIDEAPSQDLLEIRASDTNISEKGTDGQLSPCKRGVKQVWVFFFQRDIIQDNTCIFSFLQCILCSYRSQIIANKTHALLHFFLYSLHLN